MDKMIKRKFNSKLKSAIVLEALSGAMTSAEIALKYKVQPHQVNEWKRKFIENIEKMFDKEDLNREKELKKQIDKLTKLNEELKTDNDFLKKKLQSSHIEKDGR
jgi:transposase-like protein